MNKNESKYFNTAVKMDEALISLLEKKEFAYITVKEICAAAGVNRSTFYLHYENTSDLLKEATQHILDRFLSDAPLETLQSVCAREDLLAAQQAFGQCEVSLPVREYMVKLCEQTRKDDRAQLGVSPRGMLSLMRACQAYAMVQGRSFVTPDDVQKLAVPVLAHRVIARGLYGQSGSGEVIVRDALAAVAVPTEKA